MPGQIGDHLDPVPGTPADTREWYDRISGVYARFVADLEYPPTSTAIQWLDLSPGEHVVDVGCGPGRAVTEIASQVGPDGSAIGLDFAEGMCRETRSAIAAAGVDDWAGAICGDATDFPLASDGLDAALSSFVLDLLPYEDIDSALLEIARVLEHDGRFVLVSLAESGGIPTRLYRGLHRLFPTLLDCRPIPAVALLEDAGFGVERTRVDSLYGLPIRIVLATL